MSRRSRRPTPAPRVALPTPQQFVCGLLCRAGALCPTCRAVGTCLLQRKAVAS